MEGCGSLLDSLKILNLKIFGGGRLMNFEELLRVSRDFYNIFDKIFEVNKDCCDNDLLFRTVVQFAHYLDGSRPVTLVLNKHSNVDVAVSYNSFGIPLVSLEYSVILSLSGRYVTCRQAFGLLLGFYCDYFNIFEAS